jgi:hypothetical protein
MCEPYGGEENMKCVRLFFVIGLVCIMFMSMGCPAVIVGGAAGGGTIAYLKGELKSTEGVSLNRAWKATRIAMKDLEFLTEEMEKDAFDARLSARGAGGKNINVALKKISPTRTEIRIRVGLFGNESLSRQILEKIKQRF